MTMDPRPVRTLFGRLVGGKAGESAGHTFCVLVAKRTLSHISKLDRPLGARVHEPVAAKRMELGGSDDLGQFFHVCWLDIHDVETLVLNVQIPEVDSQVITADVGLAVAIHGDAVDVVGVRIRISTARHRCHNSVVVSEAWKLQVCRIPEVLRSSQRSSGTATSCSTSRS